MQGSRAPLGLLLLLLLAAASSPASSPASAHSGEAAAVSGRLEVAVGQTQIVPVAGMTPGDTLEWNWSNVGGNLTTTVAWVDNAGAPHTVNTSGLPYGRFEAPGDLSSASLTWTNVGSSDARVDWNYLCSASFWSSPSLVLPAVIPFIFLGVALAAGTWVDARAKRKAREKE